MEKIVSYEDIQEIISHASSAQLIEYIEQAFTTYSNGSAIVPPVGTLQFDEPPGEVHIKYGYIKDETHYVIKIASGFYKNSAFGLPSGNGLNLVFNQKTGVLDAILMDHGALTDIRTALAGAVAAKHLAPDKVNTIGIVGTGIQARLQLEYIKSIVDCNSVIVFGRNARNLERYKQDMVEKMPGIEIETTLDQSTLSRCNLIVTTTPSIEGIIMDDVLPGSLIIAVGADTIGKQELDTQLVARADLLVLDSTSQCTSHGEIHKAYNEGLLKNSKMIELGELISAGFERNPDDLIIADLTGIATQDMLISKYVLDHI